MKTRIRRIGQGAIASLGICGMCLAVLAADNPDVVVHDAWIRVPAPSKREAALYMVIENKSASARSIVTVTSKDARKVEMHEMKTVSPARTDVKSGMSDMANGNTATSSMEKGKEMEGSMMTMMPVAKIDIPANGQTTLAPNGYHMMLFGLKSKLSEGSKVSVILKLDDGSTVPLTAIVRQ